LLVDSEGWITAARKIRRKCEIAASLGTPILALQIDALSQLTQAEAKPLFIDRARECVRIANSFGLHVVFEYLSHKVARASGNSDPFIFCESLSHARDLLAEMSLPPRSLLLDIIHWCGDGMSVEPGSIVSDLGYIHLADHAGLSPDLLNDSDRVLPFSGKLPVKDFVQSLNASGYTGPLAIEIFPGENPPSLASIAGAVSSLERLDAH
jgi:sugar phosphate isomerase/epimerase